MNKKLKKYIFIVFVIAVIYNVLAFAIPFSSKSVSVFCFTWLFGLLSIVAQPFIGYFGFKDAETYKSKLYGWPIIYLGYIYLFIQMVICLVIFILNSFFVVPFWILIIIEVLLIGLVIIGLIAKDTCREEIFKIENNLPISTKFINDLKVDSTMLSKRILNEEIQLQFDRFVDEVTYSDPISDESLIEIEDEINKKYTLLKENLINGFFDNVSREIDELIVLLEERNERSKLSKKK